MIEKNFIMKDFWAKASLTHVPEGSVIHGGQALFYNLRRKGCLGWNRSRYLKASLKSSGDNETLIPRVR